MKDFLIETSGMIIAFLIVIAIIVVGSWVFDNTPKGKEIKQRNIEWKQKVENCLIDSNYRKDCALILYKDKQIQEHKRAQEIQSAIIFSGAFVGSSTNKR